MSKLFILMSILSLLPATLLSGQEPAGKPPAPPAAPPAAQPQPGSNASDAILATWLVVANDNEVALANLALKSAQHKDVQQFARQMVEDHAAFGKQLQPFTAAPAADSKARRAEDSSGVDERKPVDARGKVAVPTGFDHGVLLHDVGRKCLASATRMLGEQKGAAFDHAFMQLQVANHVMMVDLLEVFADHASAELRPTLAKGLATVKGHLEHGKTLCKQAEKVAQADVAGKGAHGGSGAGK
ncbi:MAG: DUF4142 domain-containing protein [Planctomycetes bacterium]|jgi:predicted outer membrane protein|nr:DUF4142 domain-containing protein [Planctomycetota bacterium]